MSRESESSAISLEDSLILSKTQQIRGALIDKLMPNGEIPSDIEEKNLLLKILDSSDKQVISKARVKNDKEANNNAKTVNDMVVEALRRSSSINATSRIEKPVLESNIIEGEILPNELLIGVEHLDYDDFMKKTEHLSKEHS